MLTAWAGVATLRSAVMVAAVGSGSSPILGSWLEGDAGVGMLAQARTKSAAGLGNRVRGFESRRGHLRIYVMAKASTR